MHACARDVKRARYHMDNIILIEHSKSKLQRKNRSYANREQYKKGEMKLMRLISTSRGTGRCKSGET